MKERMACNASETTGSNPRGAENEELVVGSRRRKEEMRTDSGEKGQGKQGIIGLKEKGKGESAAGQELEPPPPWPAKEERDSDPTRT